MNGMCSGRIMVQNEEAEYADGRIAGQLLGLFVLIVAGVAFFRRKRTLVSTVPENSEDWENCIGI